ncbi:MAG TPA: hypothetical protein VIK41_08060 [Gemmatimonadaceae bacterium]|jgi:hypothetical protein
MTTPRTRAVVSLAVTATAFRMTAIAMTAVTLGACARTPTPAVEAPAPVEGAEWFPLSIRFDNDAREYVHVYLIGDGRQWLLGRVEPGAVGTLKIPAEAFGGKLRFVQLAVIQGGRLTPDAAHDRRAELTILQPATSILSQQWRFTQGEIRSLAAGVR